MNLPRRTFLKGVIATGGAMALGATVLPSTVLADEAKTKKAIEELFGSSNASESNKITIKTPRLAENGKVVKVEVQAKLDNVESIALFVEGNRVPFVGQFNFSNGAEGWIKTRIKMGQTSNVVAVVKANGQLYQAKRMVEVTVGGCAG